MLTNVEIERKFLVINDAYKQQAVRHYDIVQGYLCKDKDRTIRVRVRDRQAFLTIKSATNQQGFARFEWEREISYDDAHALLELCLPGVIHKTRYIVPAASFEGEERAWEIDEFHERLAGLTLAEIELGRMDEPFIPADFIGEEVTSNPRYYNANM